MGFLNSETGHAKRVTRFKIQTRLSRLIQRRATGHICESRILDYLRSLILFHFLLPICAVRTYYHT